MLVVVVVFVVDVVGPFTGGIFPPGGSGGASGIFGAPVLGVVVVFVVVVVVVFVVSGGAFGTLGSVFSKAFPELEEVPLFPNNPFK